MGIHTIEIDLPCNTYANVQMVKHALKAKKSIRIDYEDKDHISCQFSSDLYVQEGVRILGRQGVDFGNYVRLIINPTTLLRDTYQPLQLYTYEKGDEKTIHKVICCIAHALGIEVTQKSYRVRRIDFTVDVRVETEAEVLSYIRLLQKGYRKPSYSHISFDANSKSVSDYKTANTHSMELCSCHKRKKDGQCYPPSVMFKAYDKIYELNNGQRCPKDAKDLNVLRLELTCAGQTLRQKLGLQKDATLKATLSAASKESSHLVKGFLKSLSPCKGEHLTYDAAKKRIEHRIKQKKMRERLLYLLRKTSDCHDLRYAKEKLEKKYALKPNQVRRIFQAFDKIDVHPVTLPNDGKIKNLPSTTTLVMWRS